MSDARPERHPAVGRQAQPAEQRRRGNFVQESWAELKKVEWPNQNQVIQGTVVVLIACMVVGVVPLSQRHRVEARRRQDHRE